MIQYIIPLFGSFFDGGIFSYALAPILALAFLATVPVCVRYFVLGR